MSGKARWDGDRARDMLLARLRRKLTACAILVSSTAKKDLSVAGTGQGRDARGKFRRVYGANPSRPGEAPHKQTGRLRASVAYEVDGTTARVGTNVKYGRILELLRDRPWLRPAFRKCLPQVARILSGE